MQFLKIRLPGRYEVKSTMAIVRVFAMLNKLKNEEMTNIALGHSDCFEMNQIVNLSAFQSSSQSKYHTELTKKVCIKISSSVCVMG